MLPLQFISLLQAWETVADDFGRILVMTLTKSAGGLSIFEGVFLLQGMAKFPVHPNGAAMSRG